MADVDPRALLREADERTKRGDRRGAIEVLLRVASHHRAQGFTLKAIALYRQVLTLDGAREDVAIDLAEAYVSLGLAGEAVATLERVAETAEGTTLLAVLGRIASLVPDHPAHERLRAMAARPPYR